MSKVIFSVQALVISAVCFAAGLALADGSGVSVDTTRYDLYRAHSDRTMVVFGETVSFKQYSPVSMLNQSFTVASDIKGGVRHTMQQQGGDKTLVIE